MIQLEDLRTGVRVEGLEVARNGCVDELRCGSGLGGGSEGALEKVLRTTVFGHSDLDGRGRFRGVLALALRGPEIGLVFGAVKRHRVTGFVGEFILDPVGVFGLQPPWESYFNKSLALLIHSDLIASGWITLLLA